MIRERVRKDNADQPLGTTKMFTGIVEELGTVASVRRESQGATLEIQADTVLADAKVGDSIAVDGVCLTVRTCMSDTFLADVSAETLRRTTLGERKAGEQVNLERALRLQDRLGGHLVLGHVDEVATISEWKDEGTSSCMRVTLSGKARRYIAYKGSVAVDGVSLTIANVVADGFEAALIPHTKQVTTLEKKRNGARVNIEVDLLARYVETLLLKDTANEAAAIDLAFLAQHGFR